MWGEARSGLLVARAFVAGGVDDRVDVDDPAEPAEGDDPDDAGENELHGGGQQSALNELAEAGDEEAADGGDDVAGGTLA